MNDRGFFICFAILFAAATIGLLVSISQHVPLGEADSPHTRGTFSIHENEIELVFDNGEVWVGRFSFAENYDSRKVVEI